MITADVLQTLVTFTTESLGRAVDAEFTESKFLGLTNGGQFCYLVHWNSAYGPVHDKVYIDYDCAKKRISATLG